MRFYSKQHLYYCGVDLHARSLFIFIIDNQGNTVAHKNIPANSDSFLKAIAPYREDIVVAVLTARTYVSVTNSFVNYFNLLDFPLERADILDKNE